MKCRRVEKLIPLYVEGDLASGIADRIASHLDLCGRCNCLADEYKDSQSWLRSTDPPEFDDAALIALKAGVLKRIEVSRPRPSLLANLMQQWSRRQVFALSTAMLIIFGVVVFYIYQTRMGVTTSIAEKADPKQDAERKASDKPLPTPDTERAAGAVLSQHRRTKNRASAKQRGQQRPLSDRTLQSLMSKANLEAPGTGVAVVAETVAGGRDVLPEMLRIEIQTGDPNIRIIWFAPKEVEGPQTEQ